jgi:hypothetical protein
MHGIRTAEDVSGTQGVMYPTLHVVATRHADNHPQVTDTRSEFLASAQNFITANYLGKKMTFLLAN